MGPKPFLEYSPRHFLVTMGGQRDTFTLILVVQVILRLLMSNYLNSKQFVVVILLFHFLFSSFAVLLTYLVQGESYKT